MLQIRLSKAPASDGSAGVKQSPVETVTVACPDHLVLADLPVAKGIGAATAASLVKTLGRRSRRQLGERVHFCVRCDFPIAIYGRLSPCEHAFCLDCARSDSLCYLVAYFGNVCGPGVHKSKYAHLNRCDERIQKIQTIKMMEGILICAAPHCLKSFLKKAEFESHIQDNHSNLLRPNADKDDGNESEAQSVRQPTASDSTARGPQRPVFSPSSNSQQHDLEDRTRRQPPREQAPSRSTMQPKPPYFGQQHHPSDTLSGSVGGIQQGFHQQSFDMQHPTQEPSQFADRQQPLGPDTSFPEYPTMQPAQTSNVPSLVTSNPMLNPPMPFGYPPYPHERAQPFYAAAPYDMPRQDSTSDIGGDQNSLLGFPQGVPSGPNFPGNYPQPWNAGIAGAPFEQAQGGGMAVDPRDTKGILAPQPMPLPPPPPPPPHALHLKQNYYSGEHGHEGQGYGWQHDSRDSFGSQG